MYCKYCGTKLIKHKITNIYYRGDTGFENFSPVGFNLTNDKQITLGYKCPKCLRITTYAQQEGIALAQKRLGIKAYAVDDSDDKQ